MEFGPPFTGGWWDWPAGMLNKMRFIQRIANSIELWEKTTGNIKGNQAAINDVYLVSQIEHGKIGALFLGNGAALDYCRQVDTWRKVNSKLSSTA